MGNPILEKIDEFGTAVEQMRKANDDSIAELQKSNEARAKELSIQSDKWNKQIELHQKAIADLVKENETKAVQIEMLEALTTRPKGTPTEQLEQKELQLWDKFVRGKMSDNGLKMQLEDVRKQLIQQKTDDTLIGTPLLGGNAVPVIIGTQIERLMLAQSDILPQVKNVSVGSSDYNELVTVPGANGGWSSETGSRSVSATPNIRKVTITHGELYAYPKVSNWALNDIFFNVTDWIMSDVAATMAISLSTAILSGSGSSQPTGMVHSAPTSGTDGGSPKRAQAVFQYVPTGLSPVTTFSGPSTADKLIDMQYSLRRPYRMDAAWAMNSTTIGAVRKLKDSYGQYLWQTNYQAGQPATLLGRPIITWEDMADATAGNALPIAYGDWDRAYLLAKIGQMAMVLDQVTVPGFTQFYTYQRYGGIPLNNDAVKFLKMSAS